MPPSMAGGTPAATLVSRHLQTHLDRRLRHILIAAAGEIYDDELLFAQGGSPLDDLGDGVGGFQGGNYAFEAGEFQEGRERLADGGVVQARRYAMGELDLAELVLQEIRARALQDPERAALKARGMFAGNNA